MMKKALLNILLLLSLMAASVAYAEEEAPSYSRIIDVPGIGPLTYYAQNDPEWARSAYEPQNSSNFRTFQMNGCGPTAAAIAIARQVPAERLPDLVDYARSPAKGFPYCPCSVNNHKCDRTHPVSYPTTAEDFYSHLPVIFGSYAAGNNRRGTLYRKEFTATSISLFSARANDYGLYYKAVRDWSQASQALDAGYSVITTVTAGVFTETSHYLFLAGVDGGYLYILDPLMREDYDALDKNHILEVVEPGLIRASLNNLDKLRLSSFYVISDEEIILQ